MDSISCDKMSKVVIASISKPPSISEESLKVPTILSINSSYNIDHLDDYDVYQVDTSSNNITITLPEIANFTNGKRMYIISDVGGNLINNPLTIQRSGTSDTIAGDSSIILNINYSSITLISNTTDIWIIS